MHDVTIYLRLVGMRVRGQMQYRASFLMQVLGSFSSTFVELLAILVLFRTFHALAGWTVGEVALLYGMVSVAFGLTEMLSAGFDNISSLIRLGEFDRILTRPVPVFVQVLSSDFQLRRLGRILEGLFALALAISWTDVQWTPWKALVLLVAILSAFVVFFTVMLVGAAITFWTVETSEVQNIFTYGGTELASYPIHIYSRWIITVFLYAVPLALTTYYPALYILGKPDPLGLPYWLRFISPLVAAVFFAVGLQVWRVGVDHYQSTGS